MEVGEGIGEFYTGIAAVRYISVHQHFLLLHINNKQALFCRRLAEINDGEQLFG